MSYRLGICLPTALKDPKIPVYMWLSMEGKWIKWKKAEDTQNGVVEADTLEELDSDDTKNVFFDREKRCSFNSFRNIRL